MSECRRGGCREKIAIVANVLDTKYYLGGTFLSMYLGRAMSRLGADVKLLSLNDFIYNDNGKYDLIITTDYTFDPVRVNSKTVFWSIDDPECLYSAKSGYNTFFTHSEGSISLHEKIGRKNVKYLPFAYDSSIFYPMNLNKTYDIVYVGNGIESKSYDIILTPAMELAEKRGLRFAIFGTYWNKRNNIKFRKYLRNPIPPDEVRRVYNSAKIVLNMHRETQRITKNSFIMRDFEARACKSFVLSDSFEGCEYFNAVVSESPEETIKLLDYYLRNDEGRNAQANREYEVIKNETYDKRAEQVYKEVIK